MLEHLLGSNRWLVGIVCLVSTTLVLADEATLRDGTTVAVVLECGPNGRLLAKGRAETWPVRDLARVQFPLQRVRPWRAGIIHTLELTNGDTLFVQLIDDDSRTLTVSTAWATRLRVPWANVRALRQRPDAQLREADEFAAESGLWGPAPAGQREQGQSTIGPASLRLDQQQSRTHTLAEPIAAGMVGVNVAPLMPAARWAVELELVGKQGQEQKLNPGQAAVLVRVGPDDEAKLVRVELPGKAGTVGQVKPPAQWARLEVEWDQASATVSLDELVLWAGRLDQPGRALRAVRLIGPARFDEFVLASARRTTERLHADGNTPLARVGTASVQLLGGEVLFGKLKSVGRTAVQLESGQARRTWAWSEVAAVVPMQQAAALVRERGEWVAVSVQSTGVLRDRLTGRVDGLDQQSLKLIHPAIGELNVPRANLTELRTIFVGERIELDRQPRHLGQQFRPRFGNPEPDGLFLRRAFRLQQLPTSVRLLATVSHLPGAGDGPEIRKSLEQGSLRTEVLLNGQVVDYLNRYVDRASATPKQLTVPLPIAALQANNTLELRQRLDPRTLQVADCEILELIIEAND